MTPIIGGRAARSAGRLADVTPSIDGAHHPGSPGIAITRPAHGAEHPAGNAAAEWARTSARARHLCERETANVRNVEFECLLSRSTGVSGGSRLCKNAALGAQTRGCAAALV